MTSQKEELITDTSDLLILGSGSDARKELLKSVGIIPDKIQIPGIDESLRDNEKALDYVKRMALEKLESLSHEEKKYVITADTIVVAGRKVLSKTSDGSEAFEILKFLSGRRHKVFTAFCVKHRGKVRSRTVKTVLKMSALSNKEIEAYIESGEWIGRAGAYSIQGRAKCFFPHISGCFTNVIGLPIPKLINVLKGMGFFNIK